MTEKINNIGIGVLLGIIVAGLPIWIYAETKIEKRVVYESKVVGLEKDIAALKEALGVDSSTLHRRISDLDKDVDAKFRAESKHYEEVNHSTEGRILMIEQDVKSLDKAVAVMHASEHGK